MNQTASVSPKRVALAVGAFQLLYGLIFIWRSSIVVDGKRWFCLFDDAMISMRYARNLADGHGLVWNPGEYVEGISNFAWTLVMAVCHLLPLEPEYACLPVQLLGIATLWAVLYATCRLADACKAPPLVAIVAVLLVGLHYNLTYFALLGMETAAVTACVTLGITGCVRAVKSGNGIILPAAWFAVAILLRNDTLSTATATLAVALLFVDRGRPRVFIAIAILLATFVAQSLWRHSYYGEWFPNTYYLKLTGWPLMTRLQAAIRNNFWTVVNYALPMMFALAAMRLRFREVALLLTAPAVAFAYSMYTGGDAWPLGRFLIPTAPALFVASALGIAGFAESVARWMERQSATPLAAIGATVVALLVLNVQSLKEWALMEQPFMTHANIANIELAVAVNEIAEPDAVVAVGFAGACPYFIPNPCVDLLGKCEPHIARMDVVPGNNRPGHNKMDPLYIIATYNPDIMLHTMSTDRREFLDRYRPVTVEVGDKVVSFAIHRRSLNIDPVSTSNWENVKLTLDRLWDLL